MIYNNLYYDFKALFPNDSNIFSELEKKTGADVEDGIHVVFGMIVCPFILQMSDDEKEKLKVAFDFIECMENDEDENVRNVADVSILENIMTDENGGFKRFEMYLGNQSREAVEYLRKFFNFD